MITGKLYDQLKFLAQVLLPALGTLYFALAGLWALPAAEKVSGTVLALDTFLGVVLHLSSNAYNKSDARFDGDIVVTEHPEGKKVSLELDGDPEEVLQKKDAITFKVQKT